MDFNFLPISPITSPVSFRLSISSRLVRTLFNLANSFLKFSRALFISADFGISNGTDFGGFFNFFFASVLVSRKIPLVFLLSVLNQVTLIFFTKILDLKAENSSVAVSISCSVSAIFSLFLLVVCLIHLELLWVLLLVLIQCLLISEKSFGKILQMSFKVFKIFKFWSHPVSKIGYVLTYVFLLSLIFPSFQYLVFFGTTQLK